MTLESRCFRDTLGTLHPRFSGEPRIVSLVPSLTELVCELGLSAQLVGRTGFCIHPRAVLRPIPKVGGTKDVKVEAVRALAPTHLIVNIDENRRETVEELAAFVPHVIVTHPCVPEDNFALYRLFGGVFGKDTEARALAAQLQAALDETAAVRAALPLERVLYLIWREPWMTVSRATYIAAMLAAVGWESPAAADGPRYPEVDWATVRHAAEDTMPRRVLLSSEPYRFTTAHVAEVAALAGLPAMLIDGEMCSWYGSRAAAGLRYLAGLRRTLAAA